MEKSKRNEEAAAEPIGKVSSSASRRKGPSLRELKEIIYRDCLFEGEVESEEEEELLINAIWKLEKISPYKDAEALIGKYYAAIERYASGGNG